MDKLLEARDVLISALVKTNEKYHANDYNIYMDIIQPIIEDKDNFYLSTADEVGKVTYARDKSDKFNEKKRIKTSFRRFLRRQLDINSHKYSDDWLNRFGCEVLSFLPFDLDSRIKLLKGNDIVKYYASTFINTCMTGKGNSLKIEFYSKNADRIQLAVMDNFIRAFVWLTDEGIYVMDRIYPSGNIDAETMFRKWATSKGFKLRSNPSSVVSVAADVVYIEDDLRLNVTVIKNAVYPYLDTFRFGKVNQSNIILSNSSLDKDVIFTRANGGYYNFIVCQLCNRIIINHSYKIEDKIVCEKCLLETHHRCASCGSVFPKKELSERRQKMLVRTGYFYCESCLIYF